MSTDLVPYDLMRKVIKLILNSFYGLKIRKDETT